VYELVFNTNALVSRYISSSYLTKIVHKSLYVTGKTNLKIPNLRNCVFQRLNVYSDARVQPIDSLTYTRRDSGFPAYLFLYTVPYTNKKEKKTSVFLSSAPFSYCISTTTPIFLFPSLVLHPSPSFRITFHLTILCQRHLHLFLRGWIELCSVALVSFKMRQKWLW
jgi:hypothetical protein